VLTEVEYFTYPCRAISVLLVSLSTIQVDSMHCNTCITSGHYTLSWFFTYKWNILEIRTVSIIKHASDRNLLKGVC